MFPVDCETTGSIFIKFSAYLQITDRGYAVKFDSDRIDSFFLFIILLAVDFRHLVQRM